MRRLGVPVVLALLGLLVATFPAQAGLGWCLSDPVVELNGTQVQILVALPDNLADAVSGPITVNVFTPARVDREVVFTDAGFNGYGEVVRFHDTFGRVSDDGSFQATALVSVPIDWQKLGGWTRVPVQVTVISGGSARSVATGTSLGTPISFTVQGSR